MLFRSILVGCAALAISACATPPKPLEFTGPSAVIADSADGGGMSGGTFFFLAEMNGQQVWPTSLSASYAASRGAGAYMKIKEAERRVPAGAVKLKLSARHVYAAPIQSLFQSGDKIYVDGTVDVTLEPDRRYKVVGFLDPFRHEVWLEDEATHAVVSTRIVDAAASADVTKSQASGLFTCCNLHYEGDWISDANWSTFPFVPAGAHIAIGKFDTDRAEVIIEGRPMKIGNEYGRKQQTIQQFIARLAVKDTPETKIASYPPDVQAAIRAGKVAVGMTKEQVVIALGYPRLDTTASTDLAEWKYSTADDETYVVAWDDNQRVKEIKATPTVLSRVAASK